ncbi:hypothetical protein EDD86DRAFT_220178 [Gorgonomyces haynaldii]|nr:hypothetical protein EDD86DRAFT_220178 [Gorgonomyces haynaldii]
MTTFSPMDHFTRPKAFMSSRWTDLISDTLCLLTFTAATFNCFHLVALQGMKNQQMSVVLRPNRLAKRLSVHLLDEPWLTPEGIYIKPVDRSDMGYALSFDAYCSNHEIFPSIGFKANENQSDGDGPWYTPEGVYVKPVDRTRLGLSVSVDIYCSKYQFWPQGGLSSKATPMDKGGRTPEQLKHSFESYIRQDYCKEHLS